MQISASFLGATTIKSDRIEGAERTFEYLRQTEIIVEGSGVQVPDGPAAKLSRQSALDGALYAHTTIHGCSQKLLLHSVNNATSANVVKTKPAYQTRVDSFPCKSLPVFSSTHSSQAIIISLR
ncbi:hypothetical protein LP7551_05073 [Roseibium album]|nr:hypothetical protein LP7551_05073 [Roseibium album]